MYRDFRTGEILLTFICEHVNTEEVERLFDKDLRLRAVQWREKRSLNANAYAWVLMEKIAVEMHSTKEEIYEEMLQRYGYLLKDDDDMPYAITLPAHLDISKVDGHFKFIKESSDGKFKAYAVIMGSSGYDSKQMSTFIDGIVSEAKDLGIEVMTPNEIAKMKALWGKEA